MLGESFIIGADKIFQIANMIFPSHFIKLREWDIYRDNIYLFSSENMTRRVYSCRRIVLIICSMLKSK